MKLPDEHGDEMVNGSVRLELRGVAIGGVRGGMAARLRGRACA
jgi:hypothetical protein